MSGGGPVNKVFNSNLGEIFPACRGSFGDIFRTFIVEAAAQSCGQKVIEARFGGKLKPCSGEIDQEACLSGVLKQ